MKIVVANTVTLNGGDAAILFGLHKTVRAAFGDVELVVYDSQPEVAKRYYPDFEFRQLMWESISGPFKNLRRNRALDKMESGVVVGALEDAVADYASADLVMSTGGTYLVEHYDLSHRWLDFAGAMQSGTPLVLFTQSLGPFEDQANITRVKRVFSASPLVLLRDGRSKKHLVEHGVDEGHLHVQADCVFALAEPETLETAKSRKLADTGRKAAISVRAWSHFKGRTKEEGMAAYKDSIAACAKWLVGEGFEVVFLSTCQGIPEYWTNDAETAYEIEALLDEETRKHVSVDDGFRDPVELSRQYGEFDLVIATRMHAAILALIGGTPVFPVAYEFKTKELFERLGVSEFTQDIDTISPEGATSDLAQMVGSIDSLRGPLMDAVAAEHESALSVAQLLQDVVE